MFWVGHVLGAEGARPDLAHASWMQLPAAGEVDVQELREAEAELLASGLLRRDGETLRCEETLMVACEQWHPDAEEVLLGLLLENARPLWLQAAAGGERLAAELIPEVALAALARLIPDPARREAFLLARARTIDARERQWLGAQGEEAVVTACRLELAGLGRDDLAAQVRRVSLISDELGYDVVAPKLNGGIRRLEVKATRALSRDLKTTRAASGDVTVLLTRNELTVGACDPDWSLAVVRIGEGEDREVLGYLAAEALTSLAPVDRDARSRWQTCRLRLPIGALGPGLPPA